jgi:hypothetical protein
MSDRLEEFVRSNKESFDRHEPDPSLWLKINPGKPQTDKRSHLNWLRYAASIALIFAGFSAGIYFLGFGSGSENTIQSQLSQEIEETEVYYRTLLNERYSELKTYLADDQETHEMLLSDMEELDEIYEELKVDLNDDVSNPEVIEAMIQNYRIKLEILEDLLLQLKEKENQDYEDEESYSL